MSEKTIKAKKPKAADVVAEIHEEKTNKWELKTRIYKLQGKDAKTPFVRLQAEDRPPRKRLLHFDEELRKQRAIRYVTNFESPFVDEQDVSGYDLAQEQIVFSHGNLIVDAHQVALQQFLDVHPWNTKNPGAGPIQFYEYDPEAVAKKEVDGMLAEAQAISAALAADLATTEAVLRPIIGSSMHELKTDRLTREILLYAKKDPHGLLAAINNDKLLFENVAYTAVDFNIINITDNGTVARWAGNSKSIVAIPFGRNPYSFLGEWFSTDEGLEIMNKITQLLKKS